MSINIVTGGKDYIFLDDTSTPPTPASGIIIYSDSGSLSSLNSGGSPASIVTDVLGTAGNISSSGGSTPTLDLIDTAVTPGAYTSADITIDSKGRITLAANGSGGGAPSTATYITQTPDGGLSSEQALSLLATGIMKSTTVTGVVSIAVAGTDYYSPGNPTDIVDSGGGTKNLLIGFGSTLPNAGELGNTGIGYGALTSTNANTQFDTAVGFNAGVSLSDAQQCTAIGSKALLSNTIQHFNTAVGYTALGSLNDVNPGGSEGNTAVGTNAAFGMNSGFQTTVVGSYALNSATTAINNCTVVGANAVQALGTFSSMVVVGDNAAKLASSIDESVIIGNSALSATTETLIRVVAVGSGTTVPDDAVQCVFIGRGAGSNVNNISNSIAIGDLALVDANDSINLGNNCKLGINTSTPGYTVDVGVISNLSVIRVSDSTATPSTPASGCLFYSVSGAPKFMNSAGVETPLGFMWIDQTTTTVTMTTNTNYISDNAALVTLTVPATAAVGDEFIIQGKGTGGWLVQFNTGQVGHLGNTATTTAGSFASTNQWDSVRIVCVTANTTFAVISSVGSITVA